ncbi:hypothetical protein [Acinetobacter parvus]|uniref:hypothetical protein n=1 Tax=Acinetobacter parvus TaxID=134533 RepID=UPI0021D15FF0|nr:MULTISPECIES: hypothetical protein [Bacteria]MCU4395359.1 hypothetical protein [Acinetobacter parvus]
MPSRKPRVALTLPDDLNVLLDQVADYQGTPKTKLITDILLECKPIFEQMLSAYKLIEENKEGTADIVKKFGAQAVVEASSKTTALAQEVASLGVKSD